MKGGYFMAEVNADLSKTTKQTITGIYNIAKNAVESNKPIVIYGMNYDGKPTTPICVFGWLDGDTYIFNASVLQVFIDKNNGLTVALNGGVEPKSE